MTTIYCDHCGKELHPDHLYCPLCGSFAPRGTRKGAPEPEVIEKPVYCPECSHSCPDNSLFCTACGKDIFKHPKGSVKIYCPSCNADNSNTARICRQCGFSLSEWFAGKGEAAIRLGLQQPFSLKESYNGILYRFPAKKNITLGRSSDNDIVIPCSYVSGQHLIVNIQDNKLIDSVSTNGTYINRSSEKINTVHLDLVSEFNVAGYFTFSLIKGMGFLAFRLSAILEEEQCRKNGDGTAFDQLRATWFVFLENEGKIFIGKTDGKVAYTPRPEEKYWMFTKVDDFYYYSDPGEDIDCILLRKNGNELPVNLKINQNELRK